MQKSRTLSSRKDIVNIVLYVGNSYIWQQGNWLRTLILQHLQLSPAKLYLQTEENRRRYSRLTTLSYLCCHSDATPRTEHGMADWLTYFTISFDRVQTDFTNANERTSDRWRKNYSIGPCWLYVTTTPSENPITEIRIRQVLCMNDKRA